MEKTLKIDLNKWQTQKDYAKENGVSPQLLQNWVKRKKIEIWDVKPLSLILVAKKKITLVEIPEK
jgi:hypothetical protein